MTEPLAWAVVFGFLVGAILGIISAFRRVPEMLDGLEGKDGG